MSCLFVCFEMQPCNRSLGSWLGDCQIHPVRQGKNNNQKRQKTQARRRWKDQLAGNKKTAPSGRGVQNREPDKWAGVLQGPWIISSLLGPVCLPLGGGTLPSTLLCPNVPWEQEATIYLGSSHSLSLRQISLLPQSLCRPEWPHPPLP